MSKPISSKQTWQWLSKQLYTAKKSLLLALLLALLTAISGMALLGLAGWFIAASALAGIAAMGLAAVTFNIFAPSAGIRGFALSRTFSRYMERMLSHDATFRVMQNVRNHVFALIIPRIPGPLSSLSQGHLLERLFNDVERLEAAWLEQLQPALLAALISVFLLLFLLWTQQFIAAALLMVFIIGILLRLSLSNRSILPSIQQLSQEQELLRSELVQAFSGRAEVIAYGTAQLLQQKWQQRFAHLKRLEYRLFIRQALNAALIQSAFQILAVSVLLLAVAGLAGQATDGPLLLATVLLLLAAVEVFQPLARASQRWWETRDTVKRMLALEQTDLPVHACTGEKTEFANNHLQVSDLSFAWPDSPPLFEQLSFVASPQHSLAIVGPSGVGKSSLLHCLIGLQAAKQGSVCLGSIMQQEANSEAWRSQFSLMLQQQQLFTGSLRDNLRMAKADASDEELWHVLRLAKLDAVVKQRGGLDFMIGPEGLHLSGGQARRLGLARVLLRDAPIVLLDEPFTGLEKDTADQLMRDIKEVLAEKTLIMVSHNKSHSVLFDQVLELKPS